jgi:hypothetical protein
LPATAAQYIPTHRRGFRPVSSLGSPQEIIA